jgi:hypothetical protein
MRCDSCGIVDRRALSKRPTTSKPGPASNGHDLRGRGADAAQRKGAAEAAPYATHYNPNKWSAAATLLAVVRPLAILRRSIPSEVP